MTTAPGIKSIGGLWIAQVIKMGLSIVVSVITIRYLGPEQYGILGVAGAAVMLFSALASFPHGSVVMRELASHGEAGVRRVLSTAFDLRLLGVVIQVLGTMIAVTLIGYDGEVRLAALFISLGYFSAPFAVIGTALEFNGRFDRVAAIDLTCSLATSAIRLGLVIMAAPIMWFAAAAIADACIAIALYLAIGKRRHLITPVSAYSIPLASTLIRDSWPLVIAGTAMAIYTRTDVLMISRLLGTVEAGYYMAAVRMTEVLYFFPCIVASVYFPTLARRRLDNEDGYYRLITNSCGVALWFGVAMAAGLTIVGPAFFSHVLGAKFNASIGVVQISAWSIPLIALSYAFGPCLTIEHATRVPIYTTLLGAAVNVVLLIIMIPLFGIYGAAFATLIAQATSFFAIFLFYRDARLFSALIQAMSPWFLVTMAKRTLAMARR